MLKVVRPPAAAALLALLMLLAGCASRVPLDVPTPRAPEPPPASPVLPPPEPAPEPAQAPEPPPAAQPAPVRPNGVMPAPETPAPSLPSSPAPLAAEQRWLTEWFGGTPVVVADEPDGVVLVSVPLAFCFDTGQATIKPPLAAVLARMAASLGRQRDAQLAIAAPADPDGLQAPERSQRLREHFQQRGVNASRIIDLGDAQTPAVLLRLLPPHR